MLAGSLRADTEAAMNAANPHGSVFQVMHPRPLISMIREFNLIGRS